MSRLYLDSGYPDITYLDARGLPFNILMGGRGTGKTYGLLKYYLERNETIIYLRRTSEQSQIAASEAMTPYKTILRDMHVGYEFPKIGKIKALFLDDRDTPAAYFLGLSTVANVRGFDASDCTAIVYDEFIPEKQSRPIKDEGEALLNAYETINRNRELDGKPPLKLWLLSNTNDIMSPILKELCLLKIMLNMEHKQLEEYVDRERGIQVVNFFASPISSRKENTALYRLAGDNFKGMALRNSFQFDTSLCISRNLKSYTPVVTVGEITIYRHKSKYLFYSTSHRQGTPPVYGTSDKEIKRFLQTYGYIYHAMCIGEMEFENIDIYYITHAILKI